MKKVFSSNDEVCHVWAQDNQEEGRAKSVFFKDHKIYSYGHHFCMARILPSGTVVMTTRTYSNSTSQHLSKARQAISHRRIVHCYDPDSDARPNKEHAEGSIKASLERAKAKGLREKTRFELRTSAVMAAQTFNEYLAALPADEQGVVRPIDTAPLELSPEEVAHYGVLTLEARAKQEYRWEQRSEKQKMDFATWEAKAATKIPDWRNHDYHGSLYGSPTMLRLSKDKENVETSMGANIPVTHALRLWPLIETVKAAGQPLEREMRLGHYNLERINADGSIVVGCHQIPYSEIEMMSVELGLNKGTS